MSSAARARRDSARLDPARSDPARSRTDRSWGPSLVGAALVVALAAGCAGAPASDPGPIRVSPDAAPGARSGVAGAPVPGATFAPCDGGFECATVPVPVDHADPAGPKIGIGIVRLPARDQARKLGVLLLNPGGPGGSGVEFAEAGVVPQEVADRFDVIGFDPRGVGRSQDVRCGIGPDTPYYGDPDPGDPADEVATNAAVDRYIASCQQRHQALLPHLGTRDVVRDVDLVREALGQEQISYLGFSYGTSIGQTYAQMYPQRVRAMVLDGVVDQSKPGLDSAQAASFENSLRQYAAACRTDPTCPVGPDAVAVLDRVRARVETQPMASPGHAPLSAGLLEIGALYPLYSKETWPALGRALAAADRGDPRPMLEQADSYFAGSNSDAYNAVTCLDNSWPTEDQQVFASARATEAVAPHFSGNVLVSGLTCADWPAPQQPLTPLAGYSGPPMVIIGTRNDPATPYANSVDLARRLPGSALISYRGDGHTVYATGGVDCVDSQVNRYLIDGTLPATPDC